MTIQAIDVHAHFGQSITDRLPFLDQLMSGDVDIVVERAELSNICLTMVSPLAALFPRLAGDPVSANDDAFKVISEFPKLRQWVVLDPLKPDTVPQAKELLLNPQCIGIKIHPEEHGYPIAEYGRKIFEFAERQGAIIQSHSGEENSLPKDLLPFADDFPEVSLIISHLGCGFDGDPTHQVKTIQNSKHGNIYTDTSSAMSLTPGLLEWAVKEIGAGKILFGTDSPLYFAPMQRARIDCAEISNKEKELILRKNAVNIFDLESTFFH